jgi:hypothetical protein
MRAGGTSGHAIAVVHSAPLGSWGQVGAALLHRGGAPWRNEHRNNSKSIYGSAVATFGCEFLPVIVPVLGPPSTSTSTSTGTGTACDSWGLQAGEAYHMSKKDDELSAARRALGLAEVGVL